MHTSVEAVFNEAEKRYLTSDELAVLGQYVDTMPNRLTLYRQLRDREVDLFQAVADQLQREFSQTPETTLEQCVKNGVLALRSCAMAMLMMDDNRLQDRLAWLKQSQQNYQSQDMDATLYRLLDKQLAQMFSGQQVALLQPFLNAIQNALGDRARAIEAAESISVSSLF